MSIKHKKDDKIIDLASITSSKAARKAAGEIFVCTCGYELVELPDNLFKADNPFSRGTGYYCNSCQMLYDDSLDKLVKKTRFAESGLKKEEFTFATVTEDKGYDDDLLNYDEYERFDPDPQDEQRLINSGATILSSRIKLTDSSGRNRTVVRRTDRRYNESQYY